MKNHHKLWAIISLIIVFSAGLVSGILLDKHLFNKKNEQRSARADYKRTSSPRYPTLDQWTQELGLTPDQKEKLQEIFKNNEEKFKTLRKDMDEDLRNIRNQLTNEIKSVLTEEQQAKYEAMIQSYRSKRRGEHENRKKQSERQNKGETR